MPPAAPEAPAPTPAELLALLRRVRVVPVITVGDAADAIPLVGALMAGGLPVVEITLRTAAGLEAIRAAASVRGAVVGAGTVLSVDQAFAAISAGARFLVSPGLDEAVVRECRARGLLGLPGVATATELLRAVALGCPAVKLFPASLLGGPAMVQALAAIVAEVSFVPTGGIDLAAAPAYLANPRVAAVGGSWMVSADAVARRDWPAIEAAARACTSLHGPEGG